MKCETVSHAEVASRICSTAERRSALGRGQQHDVMESSLLPMAASGKGVR